MKYVKNVSQVDIFLPELGFNLPPGYNHEIPGAELPLWQYSQSLAAEINAGTVVVNNSITFYTNPTEGLAQLRS